MNKIQLLDHGYVGFIEHWGSDERIVEAARMSTGKGFLGWGPKCRECGATFDTDQPCPKPTGVEYVDSGKGGHVFDAAGDEKLLRYLWENKHATPFEMAGMVIEVKAPIFVFREWHRHRTQSYNEMSARYVPLPNENYVPTVERLMINSKTNKQAGTVVGADVLDEKGAQAWRAMLKLQYAAQEEFYQAALRNGVPKELARIHLPVGRYSAMRASANLRNWLAFLTLGYGHSDRDRLRMATGAQWEIRQYANAVGEVIATKFPRTWELFLGGTK
jgi:thymidylate synthase (FAD)